MNRERIEPGPGQESVWDYPRPPKIEPCSKRVRIEIGEHVLVDTRTSYRILETSHPPVFYIPTDGIEMQWLREARHGTFCEWKGHASYYSIHVDDRVIERVAWCYKSPTTRFSAIAGHLAFYPSKVDACFVDDQLVKAQEGDFYGGWITPDIVGPFKGGAGTLGW